MITDMLLVTDSKNEFPLKGLFANGSLIDYESLCKMILPQEWGLTSLDYPFFLVLQEIEKKHRNALVRGIIIDLLIGDKSTSKNFAIDLAVYLRLSKLPLPIFIISECNLIVNNKLVIPPKSYEAVIDYGVGRFLTYKQAFDKSQSLDDNYPIYESLVDEFNLPIFLDNFIVSQPDNRHQITNEWGSVKLALNAGYTPDEINYNFPETLYFKYLNAKYPLHYLTYAERKSFLEKEKYLFPSNKIDLSSLLQKKKVLLIDDNAEKGWKSVLEKIFQCTIISEINFSGVLKISDYEDYDIVFLDLYFPNPLLKNTIDMEYSIMVLEALKQEYPQVPIIVFTASNKSWTLDEVTSKGADGMYVKEAPEYSGNSEYSKENFKTFLKTIVSCLFKYKTLRPYWEGIQTIVNDSTFQTLPEKGASKFKERIKERLEMFYGLLKKGFEETKYNKENFHFSNDELAFITLWSVLNDISEAFFEKSSKQFPIHIINNTNEINHHPKGKSYTSIRSKYEIWKIKGTNNYYIDYCVKNDSSGNIECNSKKFAELFFITDFEQVFDLNPPHNEVPPFYRTIPSPVEREGKLKVYKQTISYQIAYLIEKSSHSNKGKLFRHLITLNKVRNNLYLTHGSEISSGFYDQTEKSKRSGHNIKPEKDIKDLFELVSYLITGKENKVNL